MLVLRLQRTGRENLSTYRIVVASKHRAVKGKFLEILGHYLPQRDPPVFQYKEERIQEWLKKGAIPSNTLARLLKRSGMKGMEKFIAPYVKRKPKGETEQSAGGTAPSTAAPVPASTPEQAMEKTVPSA